MVGGWWLQHPDVEDVAGKLELNVVPVIGRGTLAEMIDLARAGFKSTWGNFKAEGIVARTETELRMRNGDRLIRRRHNSFQEKWITCEICNRIVIERRSKINCDNWYLGEWKH